MTSRSWISFLVLLRCWESLIVFTGSLPLRLWTQTASLKQHVDRWYIWQVIVLQDDSAPSILNGPGFSGSRMDQVSRETDKPLDNVDVENTEGGNCDCKKSDHDRRYLTTFSSHKFHVGFDIQHPGVFYQHRPGKIRGLAWAKSVDRFTWDSFQASFRISVIVDQQIDVFNVTVVFLLHVAFLMRVYPDLIWFVCQNIQTNKT